MRKEYKNNIMLFILCMLISTNSFSSTFIIMSELEKETIKYLKKNTSTSSSYAQLCSGGTVAPIINDKQFEDICNIMVNSPQCKNIPKEKKINCKNKEDNEIEFKSWYFIKNCSGGLFKAISQLMIFLKDSIVWIVENIKPETFQERISTGNEFYNSIINYISIEFEKAMEVEKGQDFQEMRAANAVFGSILGNLFKTIGDTINKEYVSLGCYEPETRSKMLCKAIGDVLMPPTFALSVLIKGPALLVKSNKLAWLTKEKLFEESAVAAHTKSASQIDSTLKVLVADTGVYKYITEGNQGLIDQYLHKMKDQGKTNREIVEDLKSTMSSCKMK